MEEFILCGICLLDYLLVQICAEICQSGPPLAAHNGTDNIIIEDNIYNIFCSNFLYLLL